MSQYDRYLLENSENTHAFDFTSTGPNGTIKIAVRFDETGTPGVLNLRFGNLCVDGTIDHFTINNNRDRNKVLATVAQAVYNFTEQLPGSFISFAGSTPQRTRLYKMAIAINLRELAETFNIWGYSQEFGFESFKKEGVYYSFLIKRK